MCMASGDDERRVKASKQQELTTDEIGKHILATVKGTRDNDPGDTMRVIELCEALGICRRVVVNVGTHNKDTLERTLQWLDDRGISYNRSPYTARGSGRKYWDELHFSSEDMEESIHPALRGHPNGYISFLSGAPRASLQGGQERHRPPEPLDRLLVWHLVGGRHRR